MGLISTIFGNRRKVSNPSYAEVLNGFTPIFSQFGTNIYTSDVVQQAISCVVLEILKTNPQHVRKVGNDVTSINSTIQSVLDKPNAQMTTADFLEKVTWLLFMNYNAFIIPTYYTWKDENGLEHKRYDGLYPIAPNQVDFIQDARNRLYVRFRFANGKEYTLLYSDVIHIKKNFAVNDYMGGDESGQPNNQHLLTTLDINHQLLEGVKGAMKSSFAINGVVKYNTMMDDGKVAKALKELEGHLKRSESGFLPLDLKAEFIPITKNVEMVDADTLKFIDEKILRNFGVPLCILTGDYTKAQYEAFYQKTIEPLIIKYSQAFTDVLFTDREKSFGNRIEFYPKDLIFMSVDQTIQMVTLLGNTGALYENEKRVAFGLKPLPELEGKRYMSLNWIDAKHANQYQVGGDGQDEED